MAAYKSAASEVKLASEAVTAAAEEVARSVETVGETTRVLTEEVKGMRVIGQSYVDTALYHAQFMKALEKHRSFVYHPDTFRYPPS
ncbi:MAG: hypothetical protein M1813_008187 [Trichoglossum hirsutum]|nr:MAG: hypothetical protein M1813_008187 [Trichoglossum hirsutum]